MDSASFLRWFNWHVDKRPDGCWEWMGHRNPEGYGVGTVDRKSFRAHRRAYEEAKGPIPPRLLILHSCDYPPCVNPEHLSLGNHKTNRHELLTRGPSRYVKFTRSRSKRVLLWERWAVYGHDKTGRVIECVHDVPLFGSGRRGGWA